MQSIFTLLAALSENKTKLQDCLARRKSLSVSAHQGINYQATIKSRVKAINFEHPDKKQEVKGKRTATLPKRVGRPLKLVQSDRPKIANCSNTQETEEMTNKANPTTTSSAGSVE